MTTFQITISGECTLSAEDIWPDGNAPDNPTTEDVIRFMSANWGVTGLINDWNLPCSVEVDGETALEEL